MISMILKGKGTEVVSVGPGDPVLAVARVLTERGIGAALVRDRAGRVLGIISERDIVRGMANQGQGTTQLPAERLMTRDLVTVTRNTAVAEAMELVTRHRVRHLPVIEGGELVGLVSIGDLVKARIDEAEYEAAALKAYVVFAPLNGPPRLGRRLRLIRRRPGWRLRAARRIALGGVDRPALSLVAHAAEGRAPRRSGRTTSLPLPLHRRGRGAGRPPGRPRLSLHAGMCGGAPLNKTDVCRAQSVGNGSRSPGSPALAACRPSRIASTMSGASRVSCRIRPR
jgi:CBS domain-containing protein